MCPQVRPDRPFRLALGSFIEDYANRVEIIQREAWRCLLLQWCFAVAVVVVLLLLPPLLLRSALLPVRRVVLVSLVGCCCCAALCSARRLLCQPACC